MRCFFFLELNLGGCTDLDNGNAACQLGESLPELLTVPVRIGVSDFGLDLRDTTIDVGLVAAAFDDGGVVLGDDNLASRAEHVERDAAELEPNFFSDDPATGDDRHVLQHCLAASRTLEPDGRRGERATDLVDDEGGECFTSTSSPMITEGLGSPA
ncbi:MAG: hypothetical protein R2706_14100 [Acidimicrobiales bacterium]